MKMMNRNYNKILFSILIFLSIFIFNSCGFFRCDPEIITKTETKYETPPKVWTHLYLTPKIQIEFDEEGNINTSNEELLRVVIDQHEIIKRHNQDKRFIQTWEENIPNGRDNISDN